MVGRIVRSADFELVLAQSPRSRSAHFAVHHVAKRPATPSGGTQRAAKHNLSTGDAPSCPPLVDESPVQGWWLGTVVPKRHARRAVTRNLIKRQMRMVMDAQAASLSPGLWVLRLKAPFDPARYVSAASPLLRAAARDELLGLLGAAHGASLRTEAAGLRRGSR